MIDWGLARAVAVAAAGDGAGSLAAPVDLEALAAEAAPRIAARAGLQAADLPPLEWVDRRAWIEANLASFEVVLGPALAQLPPPPAPLRGLASGLLAAELGALLGVVGRRVLGQYDVRLVRGPSPRRLLLVAPNLDGAAAELGVDRTELVSWVAIHELTHAVQFSGAPWLRPWLAGRIERLLGLLQERPDPRALLADPRALVARVVQDGPAAVLLTGERGEAVAELQAAMSLVEGHAEWVMDEVGGELLGDVAGLRAALARRRDGRPVLLRVLDRLLGFDLKLRQYRQGRAFCDAVVAGGGEAALTRAWTSQKTLPAPAELADPGAWLARTAV
ncbi:MAG TPA: zinc-dependent metalloprotease [Baekduia sp.]|nr:zinc-dependent metalloprotease [Baekduia sp.]